MRAGRNDDDPRPDEQATSNPHQGVEGLAVPERVRATRAQTAQVSTNVEPRVVDDVTKPLLTVAVWFALAACAFAQPPGTEPMEITA